MFGKQRSLEAFGGKGCGLLGGGGGQSLAWVSKYGLLKMDCGHLGMLGGCSLTKWAGWLRLQVPSWLLCSALTLRKLQVFYPEGFQEGEKSRFDVSRKATGCYWDVTSGAIIFEKRRVFVEQTNKLKVVLSIYKNVISYHFYRNPLSTVSKKFPYTFLIYRLFF